MSDFLADIAERSLTAEHAIRPRPLSVFEPFQTMGASEPLQLPEVDQDYRVPESDSMITVSKAPVAMTTQGVPADQGVAPAIAVQAQRSGVSDAIADPNLALTSPVEQPAGQDEYRVAAIQPPAQAPSIHVTGTATETVSPAPQTRKKLQAEPPEGLQTASLSRPPATAEEVGRKVQASRVPDRQPRTAGGLSERKLVKPAIERVEMERPVPGQSLQQPIAPLGPKLETAWGEKNESMEKQASTPTIHVTIGRIEVRATSAPNRNQPAQKPPQGTMSLDEYLRRRNGDGR